MNEFSIAVDVLFFRKDAFNEMRKHRPMYLAFVLPILFGFANALSRYHVLTLGMTMQEKLALVVAVGIPSMMVVVLFLQLFVLFFGKVLNYWHIFNIAGLISTPTVFTSVALLALRKFHEHLPAILNSFTIPLVIVTALYTSGLLIYGLVVCKDSRLFPPEQDKEDEAEFTPELEAEHPLHSAKAVSSSAQSLSSPITEVSSITSGVDKDQSQDLVKVMRDRNGGINVFFRSSENLDFTTVHFPNKTSALKFAENKAIELDTCIVSDLP